MNKDKCNKHHDPFGNNLCWLCDKVITSTKKQCLEHTHVKFKRLRLLDMEAMIVE